MRYLLLVVSLACLSCSHKTYYVVRHAEKAVVPAGADRALAGDPPLAEAGEARAVTLKNLMKGKKIKAIFSTNYKRTRSTMAPLSEATGIAIQLYPASADSLNSVIERIINQTKGNVVVAGHSNTVDDIANKLAGKMVVAGDLPETEYDNIFIIRRNGKKLSFKRIKYGTPSVK